MVLLIHLFSDGQKIATRLCKQINKENKIIKTVLNQLCVEENLKEPQFSVVIDTTSSFWEDNCDSNVLSGEDMIPLTKKREITHNYLLLSRSKEELEMI